MENRDFRKNLALLCALAGGAAALSSINVSTSAMEELELKPFDDASPTMDFDDASLLLDFKSIYNYYRSHPEQQATLWILIRRYEKLLGRKGAIILAVSIRDGMSKNHTIDCLSSFSAYEQSTGSKYNATAMGTLAKNLYVEQGINWTSEYEEKDLKFLVRSEKVIKDNTDALIEDFRNEYNKRTDMELTRHGAAKLADLYRLLTPEPAAIQLIGNLMFGRSRSDLLQKLYSTMDEIKKEYRDDRTMAIQILINKLDTASGINWIEK